MSLPRYHEQMSCIRPCKGLAKLVYRSVWSLVRYSFLLALFVTLFAACETNLTDLNVNPDEPLDADPNYLFSYALQQGMGNYNSDVNLEQWGVMNWMMYLASREGVEVGREYPVPSGKDAFWREQYTNTLMNTQVIINKAKADATIVNMAAAAQIWKVLVTSQLTDLWGDIPYSEALKGISDNVLSPGYDTQAQIYESMLNTLKDATAQFTNDQPFFDAQSDLIYEGDMEAWRRLGYSLMLRLATRINQVDAETYSTTLDFLADKPLIGSVNESAIFPFNAVRKNHLWETMYRGESVVQNNPSKFFVDLLSATDDPRKRVFFEEAPLSFLPFIDKYRGIPNLLPNTAEQWDDYNLNSTFGIAGDWGDISKIGEWFLRDNTPGIVMSYSEVCFLLAEASLNGLWSESAANLVQEGGRANMELYNLYGDETNFIADEEINSYVNSLPDADLEQIITQKWISFAFEQGYQAYAEYRRTGYPVLTDYYGEPIDQTIFPLRLPYPNSEYTLNRENYNQAVANQGADNEFTAMYWIPE
ncbi:MAG: SusD/RagB family nutrient-binding outer membrane lipoprotein [Salinivirgaceae bacterium]